MNDLQVADFLEACVWALVYTSLPLVMYSAAKKIREGRHLRRHKGGWGKGSGQ
jgi:hypothetical protein